LNAFIGMFIQRFVRLLPVYISYAVCLSGSFSVAKWYCMIYRSSTCEIDMYRKEKEYDIGTTVFRLNK